MIIAFKTGHVHHVAHLAKLLLLDIGLQYYGARNLIISNTQTRK